MSEENVELGLRACAAWQRFEPNEIAAFYTGGRGDRLDVGRGLRTHLSRSRRHVQMDARLSAAFERPSLEYEHVADAGDKVVVVERVRTRGRASGAAVSLSLANVYTVRGGLIARQVLHEDLAEALEAVGLSE